MLVYGYPTDPIFFLPTLKLFSHFVKKKILTVHYFSLVCSLRAFEICFCTSLTTWEICKPGKSVGSLSNHVAKITTGKKKEKKKKRKDDRLTIFMLVFADVTLNQVFFHLAYWLACKMLNSIKHEQNNSKSSACCTCVLNHQQLYFVKLQLSQLLRFCSNIVGRSVS